MGIKMPIELLPEPSLHSIELYLSIHPTCDDNTLWCGTKGDLGFVVRYWWNWERTRNREKKYDHDRNSDLGFTAWFDL